MTSHTFLLGTVIVMVVLAPQPHLSQPAQDPTLARPMVAGQTLSRSRSRRLSISTAATATTTSKWLGA